jgi:hypothetical protein
MAIANPLWRAPRIHGGLKMLGITISERTVSRILRSVPRRPSQTWKTFLRSHLGQIVSVDFFIVPTIRLRVLFVFLVLEHRRHEVLHFNVTEHLCMANSYIRRQWESGTILDSDFATGRNPSLLLMQILGYSVRASVLPGQHASDKH